MKKLISLFLVMTMLLASSTVAFAAEEYGIMLISENPAPTVGVSNQALTVDGKVKSAEVYNINDRNYFKLRDVAALLNGTEAQFNINVTSEGVVAITTGKAYAAVGGELVIGEDKSASCVPSQSAVTVDGKAVELAAYDLGGDDFFLLQDLGKALDFYVGYDEVNRAVQIITPKADAIRAAMKDIAEDPEHTLGVASLAILKEGEIFFADTIGSARIDANDPAKNVPANADTKFRIASISKLFTATAAWQLIEQGKLDPEKDVSEYLGFELRNPNFPDTPITTKMLMSHTSSVREDGDNSGAYNIPYGHDIKEFFTPGAEYYCEGCWAPETEAPGEFFEYCNMNYCLVATMIENITGERFDKYVAANVLEPLGLTANFNVAAMSPETQAQIATLYRPLDEEGNIDPVNGKWTPTADDFSQGYPQESMYDDYVIGSNGSLFGPMGSLRISIKELCALVQMFSNGGQYNGHQILKSETIEKMFTPVWTYDPETVNGDNYYDLMLCYGMGPQTFTNVDWSDRLVEDQDLPFVGHTAGAYGLLGCLTFDLENGNGIIYVIADPGIDEDTYFSDYSAFYGWEADLLTLGAQYANFDY